MIKQPTLTENEMDIILIQSKWYDSCGGPITSDKHNRIWFLSEKTYISRIVLDFNKNHVYRRCKGKYSYSETNQPITVEPLTIRLFNKIWKVKQIEKPNLQCFSRHPYIDNPIKEKDGVHGWSPYIEDHTREFTLDFIIDSLVGPVNGKSLQEQLTLWEKDQ